MMFTIHMVLGIIAAFWVHKDAKERGLESKTAFLWAVGVAAEVIIFLPLYLMFGRKTKPRPVPAAMNNSEIIDIKAIPIEETIQCPMCAGRVREDFKICPYCGHTLQPKCLKCGENLRRDWRVCPYCQTETAEK